MAIDYDRLMALEIPDREQSYGPRDVMLYALGLGIGLDPLDPDELSFVYEHDLLVLPTMAVVLGHPGFWLRELDTGVDWMRIVHGEQTLRVHAPLPTEATVIGRSHVVDVIDKGEGRGALIISERVLTEKSSGRTLATVGQTTFCRGDGGFGGPARPQRPADSVPDRAPDLSFDAPTSAQGALIYRLSGDYNPLHADPAIARTAKFDRPILHGLASFGIAGRALVRTVCGNRPEAVTSMQARFTAPLVPGETLRTEIWQDASRIRFQVRAVERDVIAVGNGQATLMS